MICGVNITGKIKLLSIVGLCSKKAETKPDPGT
jgi:hypothetical protein